MDVVVHGTCDPAFSDVRDAFATNFVERGEIGASCSVIIGDRTVVDLWGGWADADLQRAWEHNTLVNIYSVGKSLISLLALRLVDAGVLGLDDPIARVWPEFGANGKEAATIRHALTHRAGVPSIAVDLTNDDLFTWETMTTALAASPPWYEPGSRITYHTNTFGHLVGEIVRRAGGLMPGEALRALTGPLEADVFWGVPQSLLPRCADVIGALTELPPTLDWHSLEPDQRTIFRGYFNPPGYSSHGVVNSVAWRTAQIPSTNAHASANGIARVYRALAEDGQLLSTELRDEATRIQAAGPCPVLGEDIAVGLGFVPTSKRRPLGTGARSFGHFGTGGALGFADPDLRLGFGYVMNQVIPRWQSTRNRALIDTLYVAL